MPRHVVVLFTGEIASASWPRTFCFQPWYTFPLQTPTRLIIARPAICVASTWFAGLIFFNSIDLLRRQINTHVVYDFQSLGGKKIARSKNYEISFYQMNDIKSFLYVILQYLPKSFYHCPPYRSTTRKLLLLS